jgi:hypothetical protein
VGLRFPGAPEIGNRKGGPLPRFDIDDVAFALREQRRRGRRDDERKAHIPKTREQNLKFFHRFS